MQKKQLGRRKFLQNAAIASLSAGASTLLPKSLGASVTPAQGGGADNNAQVPQGPLPIGLHTIYVNGVVITMDSNSPSAQAVALDRDRILAVGSNAEIRKLANAKTRVIDLGNKVLLPGLISPHDHFP